MIKMTPEIAHAAAWDAGNRSMKDHGRHNWNVDDYNAACDEYDRLYPDPCGGRSCDECEIGGCDHGREVV